MAPAPALSEVGLLRQGLQSWNPQDHLPGVKLLGPPHKVPFAASAVASPAGTLVAGAAAPSCLCAPALPLPGRPSPTSHTGLFVPAVCVVHGEAPPYQARRSPSR